MRSGVPKSQLGSEFDAFLFAPLGEDRNGVPLSIVSLFARMNLDPWQEAGDLAALCAQEAARRLGLCLEGLTDPTLKQATSGGGFRPRRALLPGHPPATFNTVIVGAASGTLPDH